MDDLTKKLRALNDKVSEPDFDISLTEILARRHQPEPQNVPYKTLMNAAAVAGFILLANVATMLWAGHKHMPVTDANAGNTYLQTYNLSIY